MFQHVYFNKEKFCLELLDQTKLPLQELWINCKTMNEVVLAIQTMVIRGAPLLGVAAAYACCLALNERIESSLEYKTVVWQEELKLDLKKIAEVRPTAVNLSWGVKQMQQLWQEVELKQKQENLSELTKEELLSIWLEKAEQIFEQDICINKKIGEFGAALLSENETIMTHCNAGALATAGYGTALGVIRTGQSKGLNLKVIANETRPFLQGSRLTAYELSLDNIPVTVACDNACGYLMQLGLVNKVIVGADRIALNGDTANKIGTYTVAVLAAAHNIPFYVAAPLSTFDSGILTGKDIKIEQRPAREVTNFAEKAVCSELLPVYNFSFDITPAKYIAGIITELGVITAPYEEKIKAFKSNYDKGLGNQAVIGVYFK